MIAEGRGCFPPLPSGPKTSFLFAVFRATTHILNPFKKTTSLLSSQIGSRCRAWKSMSKIVIDESGKQDNRSASRTLRNCAREGTRAGNGSVARVKPAGVRVLQMTVFQQSALGSLWAKSKKRAKT